MDTPKKKNDIYNYYSIAESFRELERGEIEKLGLKGHKSRILKLMTMTNVQKNIMYAFNFKYFVINNYLKSIGIKKVWNRF